MKKRLLAVLLAGLMLLSAAGCGDKEKIANGGDAAQQGEVTQTTPAEPKLPGVAQELSDEIDSISKANTAVGVSVVAFENGEITYTHHYGYANKAKEIVPDDSTQYRMASITKLISAITIMKAVDDCSLGLDEDISYYLGYQVRNPKFKDEKITMRQLLSHSSSISDTPKFESGDYASNKALLKSAAPFTKYAPGKGYEYSNLGVQTAGNVLEKAIHENFHDYADREIFAPMGVNAAYLASSMKDTSHIAVIYNSKGGVSRSVSAQLGPKRTRPLGELRGVVQGSLTISPMDYAKFLIMLVNGGEYNGTQIISKESANEILTTQYEDEKVSYCLCARKCSKLVDGKTIYCHSGEAFGILSAYAFDSETKNGVVVVTNGAKQKFDDDSGLSVGCNDIVEAVFSHMQ